MRTAGIDLSSQDRKTATCVMSWGEGRGTIESLHLDVSDTEIVAMIGDVDKVGIDVPLGWPKAFVEALAQLSGEGSWPADYLHSNTKDFRYRRTDLHTWRTIGGSPPLSVSTDRIGIPAMRAAALLSRLSPPVVRSGSGAIVEVYPAAALRIWGLPSSRYKNAENSMALEALVVEFVAAARWLTMSTEQRSQCQASDDVFDALIAACVARAAALGLVRSIPNEEAEAARREGWIALPTKDSLDQLGAAITDFGSHPI
jgi:predicted nuclease with RNAse H fold